MSFSPPVRAAHRSGCAGEVLAAGSRDVPGVTDALFPHVSPALQLGAPVQPRADPVSGVDRRPGRDGVREDQGPLGERDRLPQVRRTGDEDSVERAVVELEPDLPRGRIRELETGVQCEADRRNPGGHDYRIVGGSPTVDGDPVRLRCRDILGLDLQPRAVRVELKTPVWLAATVVRILRGRRVAHGVGEGSADRELGCTRVGQPRVVVRDPLISGCRRLRKVRRVS